MIDPIKPEDIVDGKLRQIPDAVMETFNELIAKNFSGESAVVKQNQVMSALADKGYTDRGQIFDNHWLDVEDIYRKAGWKVSYNRHTTSRMKRTLSSLNSMKTGRKLGPKSRINLAVESVNRELRNLNDGSKYSAGLASEGYVGGYAAALQDVLLILNGVEPCVQPRFWESGRK